MDDNDKGTAEEESAVAAYKLVGNNQTIKILGLLGKRIEEKWPVLSRQEK